MAENLFVAWQDDQTRSWITIAKLTRESNGYEFAFTKGVEKLRRAPEELFGMKSHDVFRFEELLPIFKNRLPPRSRSDFKRMLRWLRLTGDEDEFTLLSRFGLIPGTDSVLLYPEPRVAHGTYSLEFFVHGIRHMHPEAMRFCEAAVPGDVLLPILDVQNPVDPNAVALRTLGQVLVGYLPAFYAADLCQILLDPKTGRDARFSVVQNNHDAPLQIRLLVRVDARVRASFRPLDTDVHTPLWRHTNPRTTVTVTA